MSNGLNSDANAPPVRSRCTDPHRRSKSVGGKRWMNAIENSADWAASSSVFQCAPVTCSYWLGHGEWAGKVYAREGRCGKWSRGARQSGHERVKAAGRARFLCNAPMVDMIDDATHERCVLHGLSDGEICLPLLLASLC
jgi:hypothetical protein